MTRQFFAYWASRLKFLDVHYHARPDSYHRRCSAFEAGKEYARYQGGVVLKNLLGSVSALAATMQEMSLPVFGSVVLNEAAGGVCLNTVRQALSQYQFEGAPRLLVHLPTVVSSAHKSILSRTFSNEYARYFAGQSLSVTDEDGKLLPDIEVLIHFARHHDIVISYGHTSKDQTLRLIEAVERVGGLTNRQTRSRGFRRQNSARWENTTGSMKVVWIYHECGQEIREHYAVTLTQNSAPARNRIPA